MQKTTLELKEEIKQMKANMNLMDKEFQRMKVKFLAERQVNKNIEEEREIYEERVNELKLINERYGKIVDMFFQDQLDRTW